MYIYRCLSIGILLCTACALPQASDVTQVESKREAVAVVADTIAGFAMPAEKSRFRLGANVRHDELNGYKRVVGDEGVIAIDPHGALLSVPNGGAPGTRISFDRAASEHEAMARAYLSDAGLPKDQIGDVQNNAYVETLDTVMDLAKTGIPTVTQHNYYTVVHRRIGDLTVFGSYAWVRMNSEEEVVSEEIFWPDLPASLIADAEAIQQAKPQLLDKLPAELRERASGATVAIWHSPFTQARFEAVAALVVPGEGTEGERRFDVSGRELRFEYEQAKPMNSRPKPTK